MEALFFVGKDGSRRVWENAKCKMEVVKCHSAVFTAETLRGRVERNGRKRMQRSQQAADTQGAPVNWSSALEGLSSGLALASLPFGLAVSLDGFARQG
jgi:hypothetical protein